MRANNSTLTVNNPKHIVGAGQLLYLRAHEARLLACCIRSSSSMAVPSLSMPVRRVSRPLRCVHAPFVTGGRTTRGSLWLQVSSGHGLGCREKPQLVARLR